jgi:stearoyl-CoA desaturase (delta-9 desaturase)
MSRAARISNLLAVTIPFVAFIVAVVALWDRGVGWHDLALFAGFYLATALGVTVGFHRMLTHRSFMTSKPIEYLFAVLGSMSVQGPVIAWVADHRKHHAHADEEGDPHSPHVGAGSGLRGLIHAHVGWLVMDQGQARKRKYAADLVEDAGMRSISRGFPLIVLAGLALPAAIGWAITGRATGALTGFLWGGLVRIFFVHHVTWSINSVCHFFGRRRFDIEDHSTNVWWLALPSMGEAWHHNHHAFPRSAAHGMGRFELDPSAWVIRGLEKLGLVWNVVRIAPERQAQKLVVPAHERELTAAGS